jgi:benzoyl-CoA reductase/2-hydroxyglutaryl-CoA dehydratase subunit BcrC/BadD/HgdB
MKSIEMLRDMGYNVYPLSLPSRKDNDISRNYWQNSVKEFAVDLMKFTGKKITASRLKKALARKNLARDEYRRFYNLRKSVPAAILGKDAFLVTDSYFTDDLESWTQALKKLNDELEQNISSEEGGPGRPRFLFTGSPPVFPNLKVPLLVEELGGLIAMDEVCSSSRILYDKPYYEEEALYDMVPAIADTYLKPCTCPCFAMNDERKDKLALLIEDFSIDGVIYQAFSGCNLYEMEHMGIGNFLKEMKVPMLYIESDYSQEDTGQLSTRIEAFIESVKIKRRKKRKN